MQKSKIANLPSGVGVTKTKSGRGLVYWRVRFGKRFTGGPTVRRDFPTLAKAKAWIFGEGQNQRANPGSMVALKKEAGASAFKLSAAQISEAAAAFKRLGEAGTLTEAVNYYLKHSRPVGGAYSLQEAIDALIKDKETAGKGQRHLKGLRWSLERFAQDFPKIQLHEVTRRHVEEWLGEEDFSTTTRRNYLRDLSILFNFALRRDWVAKTPLTGITKPTPGPSEIRILSPQDSAELMSTVRSVCPEIAVALAIKLFAGLRTSELFCLDWSKIGTNQITVDAKSSKTRARRVVTISRNLKAWLEMEGEKRGPVTGSQNNAWHRRLQHVEETMNLVRRQDGRTEFRLPPNFARHSFCSYHYAFHRNENMTAAEAGNSPAVIFSNYREMVSPEEAARYWEIFP